MCWACPVSRTSSVFEGINDLGAASAGGGGNAANGMQAAWWIASARKVKGAKVIGGDP